MADLAHWQHLASDAVNWISDYVQHNKVTSSLIATNAVLLTWYLIWKSTRRQRLLDKIPALAGYPLVGDVLSMEADPCGEWVEGPGAPHCILYISSYRELICTTMLIYFSNELRYKVIQKHFTYIEVPMLAADKIHERWRVDNTNICMINICFRVVKVMYNLHVCYSRSFLTNLSDKTTPNKQDVARMFTHIIWNTWIRWHYQRSDTKKLFM